MELTTLYEVTGKFAAVTNNHVGSNTFDGKMRGGEISLKKGAPLQVKNCVICMFIEG